PVPVLRVLRLIRLPPYSLSVVETLRLLPARPRTLTRVRLELRRSRLLLQEVSLVRLALPRSSHRRPVLLPIVQLVLRWSRGPLPGHVLRLLRRLEPTW